MRPMVNPGTGVWCCQHLETPRTTTGSGGDARMLRRRLTSGQYCNARFHGERRTLPPRVRTASNSSESGTQGTDRQETFADIMGDIFSALTGMDPRQSKQHRGAHVYLDTVSYHPPSSDVSLIQNITMEIQPNTLALVYGCSGGGKSTLLHVMAGLSRETSGTVSFNGPMGTPLDSAARLQEAGIVFQFPERHFLGKTLQEELTMTWPTSSMHSAMHQALVTRTYQVLDAVGLRQIPLDTPLDHLSGGYKRRVALAVQLIRQPKLLLLDEPLAGLDWSARHDLISVLDSLRSDCTVLVVSHDLREIQSLVHQQFRMHKGGFLSATSAFPEYI